MCLALSFARQLRIIAFSFVNILSLQVSKPCLDSPSRNEYGNPILFRPDRNAAQTTRFIERLQFRIDAFSVAIDHDDESLLNVSPARSVGFKFVRKLFLNELLS